MCDDVSVCLIIIMLQKIALKIVTAGIRHEILRKTTNNTKCKDICSLVK